MKFWVPQYLYTSYLTNLSRNDTVMNLYMFTILLWLMVNLDKILFYLFNSKILYHELLCSSLLIDPACLV